VTPRFHVGTSGFGYREWKGKFYPKDLPAEDYLRYYAERFDATEVNSSFYRMPRAPVLRAWARQTPQGFSFSFKAPASITHLRRLLAAEAPLRAFLDATASVGPKLGVLVFQLPPGFKKDLPRLEEFLRLLPRRRRCAFEFRHRSWFSDDVLEALKARGVALCVNDADVEGCPLAATADWGVAKLRRVRYSAASLRSWAAKLARQPWKEAYVFFKHEETASGPKLATRFRSLVPQVALTAAER